MTRQQGDGYALPIRHTTPEPPTPEDARHAALVACSHATDVDDARLLVEALGLREWL